MIRLLHDLRVLTVGRRSNGNAIRPLIGAVGRYLGWPIGHAYSFDPGTGCLRPSALWHEAVGRSVHPGRLHSMQPVTLRPGEDLPGRAFASHRAEWVADLTLERSSPRVAAIHATGVRAGVAVPVVVNGAVDTVMEILSDTVIPPNSEILSVLEYVAAAWGRVREAERLEAVGPLLHGVVPREELCLHRSAAAHMRDAIVVSTIGGGGADPTILYANAAFSRMTGYSEPEVVGCGLSLLSGEKTSGDAFRTTYEQAQRGDTGSTELVAYRKDGREFLMAWSATPVLEADGTVRYVASVLRDMSEERRIQRTLERAERDSLTGLSTREVVEGRLQVAIERLGREPDARFALLFLDLDGFKAINDEHGHVVGDRLLASAARRLEGAIRPRDSLARFGGDEFVVLIEHGLDFPSVAMVAERIRDRMAAPFDVQGKPLSVPVSIGVSLGEPGHRRPEDVIRDADAAMYEAKRARRGGVVFFGGMAEAAASMAPALP